MLLNYVTIRLEGLNFERFLFFIKQNNIKLYNVKKNDNKELIFSIAKNDYKKLSILKALKNYNVTTFKWTGSDVYFNAAKKHIGFALGLIFITVMFVLFSFFTFNINIMGTSKIKNNEIVAYLKTKNISMFKLNNIDNQQVELWLKEKFEDISLVSVNKIGTNIVINIKEKETVNDEQHEPVIAPANMYITKLEVYQGYTTFKVGDIAIKGEVLVYDYIINDKGEKSPCKPLVLIEYDAWYTGSVVFETQKQEKVKTGKKFVYSYLTLFNKDFLTTKKQNHFALYSKVEKNGYAFGNFFLPIKYSKTTYYELKLVTKKYDYEKNKNKIINQSKKLAYNQFPNNLAVLEEQVIESVLENKIIVQTVLKAKASIILN